MEKDQIYFIKNLPLNDSACLKTISIEKASL
jgi:hypothetical protein